RQQPSQHRIVGPLRGARTDARQLGELVLRGLLRARLQHVLDLAHQAAQHGRLLLLEPTDHLAAFAAPFPHGCSIVAHRPAAWSFATSPSTFSLVPDDTTALPL